MKKSHLVLDRVEEVNRLLRENEKSYTAVAPKFPLVAGVKKFADFLKKEFQGGGIRPEGISFFKTGKVPAQEELQDIVDYIADNKMGFRRAQTPKKLSKFIKGRSLYHVCNLSHLILFDLVGWINPFDLSWLLYEYLKDDNLEMDGDDDMEIALFTEVDLRSCLFYNPIPSRIFRGLLQNSKLRNDKDIHRILRHGVVLEIDYDKMVVPFTDYECITTRPTMSGAPDGLEVVLPMFYQGPKQDSYKVIALLEIDDDFAKTRSSLNWF